MPTPAAPPPAAPPRVGLAPAAPADVPRVDGGGVARRSGSTFADALRGRIRDGRAGRPGSDEPQRRTPARPESAGPRAEHPEIRQGDEADTPSPVEPDPPAVAVDAAEPAGTDAGAAGDAVGPPGPGTDPAPLAEPPVTDTPVTDADSPTVGGPVPIAELPPSVASPTGDPVPPNPVASGSAGGATVERRPREPGRAADTRVVNVGSSEDGTGDAPVAPTAAAPERAAASGGVAETDAAAARSGPVAGETHTAMSSGPAEGENPARAADPASVAAASDVRRPAADGDGVPANGTVAAGTSSAASAVAPTAAPPASAPAPVTPSADTARPASPVDPITPGVGRAVTGNPPPAPVGGLPQTRADADRPATETTDGTPGDVGALKAAGGRAAAGEPSRGPVTPVVRQTVDAVRGAIEAGRPLRVRLDPAELGTLRIEVGRSADGVTVRIEAAGATARRMLTEQLPALRESLAAAGVTVDRVEIEPARDGRPADGDDRRGDRGSDRGGQSSGNSFADRGRRGRGPSPARPARTPSPHVPDAPHRTAVPLAGLDIQI